MVNVEFYNFEGEVWYYKDGLSTQYRESDKVITKDMVESLTEFYPKAFKALQKQYANSSANPNYYLYRIVHRFCRCNFGEIDNRPDVDQAGRFNLERVTCPLRGECKLENIVCNPEFNTKISDSEMRVINLLYNKYSDHQIADKLYLSQHTVRNHIRNALARLDLHSKAELLVYVVERNLVKKDYE